MIKSQILMPYALMLYNMQTSGFEVTFVATGGRNWSFLTEPE